MTENKVVPFRQKDEIDDPLTEILRSGAKRLIEQAVEAEFAAFLASHADLKLPDGRQRVVRHGHDPVRPIQTGIGPVEVEKPKARDRGAASGRRAHSLFVVDPAEMGAAHEEPRRAFAGALSARNFDGRFSGSADGLARQGRAQSFARRDRAAEGRVGGRISSAGKSAICRLGAMFTCGPTAFICKLGWSRRPNACWC